MNFNYHKQTFKLTHEVPISFIPAFWHGKTTYYPKNKNKDSHFYLQNRQ